MSGHTKQQSFFNTLHKLHFCEVHPVSEASLILQWKDRDLLAVL